MLAIVENHRCDCGRVRKFLLDVAIVVEIMIADERKNGTSTFSAGGAQPPGIIDMRPSVANRFVDAECRVSSATEGAVSTPKATRRLSWLPVADSG